MAKARSAGRNFAGVVVDTGMVNRWVALIRGPGGGIAVGQAKGQAAAQKLADDAARELNSGLCQHEWDTAIEAMEYAEVVQTSVFGKMKANSGIPSDNPYGRYLKARAALRRALGLPPG
jgi:hypothetical protein